jgi:hypothetical protein
MKIFSNAMLKFAEAFIIQQGGLDRVSSSAAVGHGSLNK